MLPVLLRPDHGVEVQEAVRLVLVRHRAEEHAEVRAGIVDVHIGIGIARPVAGVPPHAAVFGAGLLGENGVEAVDYRAPRRQVLHRRIKSVRMVLRGDHHHHLGIKLPELLARLLDVLVLAGRTLVESVDVDLVEKPEFLRLLVVRAERLDVRISRSVEVAEVDADELSLLLEILDDFPVDSLLALGIGRAVDVVNVDQMVGKHARMLEPQRLPALGVARHFRRAEALVRYGSRNRGVVRQRERTHLRDERNLHGRVSCALHGNIAPVDARLVGRKSPHAHHPALPVANDYINRPRTLDERVGVPAHIVKARIRLANSPYERDEIAVDLRRRNLRAVFRHEITHFDRHIAHAVVDRLGHDLEALLLVETEGDGHFISVKERGVLLAREHLLLGVCGEDHERRILAARIRFAARCCRLGARNGEGKALRLVPDGFLHLLRLLAQLAGTVRQRLLQCGRKAGRCNLLQRGVAARLYPAARLVLHGLLELGQVLHKLVALHLLLALFAAVVYLDLAVLQKLNAVYDEGAVLLYVSGKRKVDDVVPAGELRELYAVDVALCAHRGRIDPEGVPVVLSEEDLDPQLVRHRVHEVERKEFEMLPVVVPDKSFQLRHEGAALRLQLDGPFPARGKSVRNADNLGLGIGRLPLLTLPRRLKIVEAVCGESGKRGCQEHGDGRKFHRKPFFFRGDSVLI